MSSAQDITQGVTLNNPGGSVYLSMKNTDYYIARQTDTGKLQIFDISTKSLKYNLFSNINYPNSFPV